MAFLDQHFRLISCGFKRIENISRRLTDYSRHLLLSK